jgi:hypothetical protein
MKTTRLIPLLVSLLLSVAVTGLSATTRDNRANPDGDETLSPGEELVYTPSRLSLTLRGGWARRTATIAPGAEQALEGLISGYTVGFDAYHYVSNGFSIGVEYDLFHTGKEDGLHINIHYMAPTVLFTFPSRYNRSNFFLSGSFLGYALYSDKLEHASGTIVTNTGGNLASALFLGYSAFCSERLSLVFRAGLVTSSLGQMTQTANGQKTVIKLNNAREDLTSVRISLGLCLR